ncbi:CHAT domain-containing protein [Robertmurraya kyonggiensis]|uniref:CHAT domain-containing protein n=1 Tax=Robertmurraya kyonggiensis TaxID=1037680 RepID=A0A4U1CXY4_9BACI|nr:CHAT domain-containing protein [Robertmurraya kyonggiensis]TKC14752.1 CHAT domain-containing protein [Robertmurraya kyonggiensis]
MSLIETYRRTIKRKKEELSKLRTSKAIVVGKVPSHKKKILSAQATIGRTKSATTMGSKSREIEREEKKLADIDKKVAEIDKKIAKIEGDIISEEKKLGREVEREQKKRDTAEKKRIAANEKRMKEVSGMLDKHGKMHQETNKTLEELKNLPEKIKVLFMASNPLDAQPLRLDEEARAIQEMIRKSEHRDSVSFETRWATRALDVIQAINEEEPTIIHFSGHGSDTDEIVFQDNQGNAKFVSKEAIVQTMMSASADIKLVFFNTCFSYGQAEAVVQHVDAAIGMTTTIGDDAARVFAAQFYSAIGFGLSVKKAFEQGKAALMLEGIPEEDTPQLYVKDEINPNELIIVKPQ